MGHERLAMYVVVGVVLGVTLLSGPLVPGALVHAPEATVPGSGSVTVSTPPLPTDVRLDAASLGAGGYYLRVPDTTARISNVTGNPILAYKIVVDDLGYATSSTYFLGGESAGTLRLSIEREAFSDEEIDAQQYQGTLTVLVRDGDGTRYLRTRTVTIEVAE